MADNADSFLDNVFNQDKIDDFKQEAGMAYEHRVLKVVMLKLGLAEHIKPMEYATKDLTGKARISVIQFNEMFQTLPVYITLKQIGYVYHTTVPDLFNKFTDMKIIDAWVSAYEETDKRKPMALIFDFPGVKGAKLVCHNSLAQLRDDDNETRIVRYIGKGAKRQLLCIERLDPFLEVLKRDLAI